MIEMVSGRVVVSLTLEEARNIYRHDRLSAGSPARSTLSELRSCLARTLARAQVNR